MAYTIHDTEGNVAATVADGSTTTLGNITLIGKNFAGYGELQNENFVALLENFASTAAPTGPRAGQLWWDKTNQAAKIYSGTAWKAISQSTVSASAPGAPIAGDVWFDTTNLQFKVYSGSAWLVIGPDYTSAQGVTGVVPTTVIDNLSNTRIIFRLVANNTTIGVVSHNPQFTANAPIDGFGSGNPVINPGITLTTYAQAAGFQTWNGSTTTSYASTASPAFTGTPTAPTASANTNNTQLATTAYVDTGLATKIGSVSPTFTGTPLAPTAAPGTNTTQLATTAFCNAAITVIKGPTDVTNLTTIRQLAAAINDDPNFYNTVLTGGGVAGTPLGFSTALNANVDARFTAVNVAISNKAGTVSPTFTGTPIAPTASAGTNSTQIATTAYVDTANVAVLTKVLGGLGVGTLDTFQRVYTSLGGDPAYATNMAASLVNINSAIGLKAALNSPVFTGTPTAPTPSISDLSTTIATTAYVRGYLASGSAYLWDGSRKWVSTGVPTTQGVDGDIWFQIGL